MKEIYVKSATPATINSSTFYSYSATLYVPTGAKATYQAAAYWKKFKNIVEMDFAPEGLVGDIDGDGVLDVADVTALIGAVLGTDAATDVADMDGDGVLDVADVTKLIAIILGSEEAANAALEW